MSIEEKADKLLNINKSDFVPEDRRGFILPDDDCDAKGGALVKVKDNDVEKASGDGLSQYIAQISKFPVLTSEQEFELASRVKKYGDKDAAQKLVQSHLRLVVNHH